MRRGEVVRCGGVVMPCAGSVLRSAVADLLAASTGPVTPIVSRDDRKFFRFILTIMVILLPLGSA